MGFELIRVNQLIAEKKISIVSPSIKLQTDDIYDAGKTAVVSQDQEFIVGYTDLVDPKLVDIPFVVFGDHTEIFKFIDFPFLQGADGIKIIKANNKFIDPKFLYYAFKSCYYPTGFYQRHFKLLKKTFIPNLPLFHQKKLSTVLDNYDQLIETNSKRIKLLESIAEQIYKEWFVRFRYPGHKNNKIKNGLPNGWKILELKDFGISLSSGSRPKGGIDDSLKNGIPSFGAEVIGDLGTFDFSSVKYIPNEFYQKMKRGKNTSSDILIYKDGAYIGKTTMFMDGYPFEKYCINEHVFFIEPNDSDYKNYLYFTLHQKEMFELMQVLNRNAAQPGLSQDDILRIKIKIPDKVTIRSFNKLIDDIMHSIFKYAKQNQLLVQQRDALLPRLMSGKLSVEGKEIV